MLIDKASEGKLKTLLSHSLTVRVTMILSLRDIVDSLKENKKKKDRLTTPKMKALTNMKLTIFEKT